MNTKNKLYLLKAKMNYKDDDGKEKTVINTYIGTISPTNRIKYFEGAWFDEDNKFVGSVSFSKEQFIKEVQDCRELSITLTDKPFDIEQ